MSTPPPVTTEVPDKVRTYTRWMIALIVATVVVYLVGLPVALGALLFAPAAIVVGILALVASYGREGMASVRVSVAIGIGVAAFATLSSAGSIILYDVIVERNACQARALTQTAQRECDQAYDQGYRDTLEKYGITLPD